MLTSQKVNEYLQFQGVILNLFYNSLSLLIWNNMLCLYVSNSSSIQVFENIIITFSYCLKI